MPRRSLGPISLVLIIPLAGLFVWGLGTVAEFNYTPWLLLLGWIFVGGSLMSLTPTMRGLRAEANAKRAQADAEESAKRAQAEGDALATLDLGGRVMGNGQRALVKASTLRGIGGSFAAGFTAGRDKQELPDWVEVAIMSFIGSGEVVVQLKDGTLKEVPLKDVRML